MKIAFVFPGQGSQAVGMGQELAQQIPVAAEVFDVADRAYGNGLKKLCFEGPEETLKQTENTQPALVTTSIACLRALERYGVKADLVAGHSVGEYSALVAAGALKLEDAVRITRLRGRLMESSCPAGLGGMAAIMGLEPEQVEKLFEGVPADEIADIAAINTPGQVVIAGHKSALLPVVEKAKGAGAMNATMLVVSGPFHSRLMKNARDGLSGALGEIKMNRTTLPVVCNVDAKPHQEPDELRSMLLDQLTKPVLWQATMAEMVKQGITVFIELGAGRVLSGLIKKFDRKITCHSVRDPESLARTVEALRADGYPVKDPA